LKYYKQISDTSSVSHTLCELGELYFEINDFKTSKEYFVDGLGISKQIDDIVNEVRTNTGLAKLYVRFHDTDKASGYLSKAEELARSRNAYKELSKIFKIYSDYYNAAGLRNEAKESLEMHYEYLKKIINLEEENKINAIMLGHLSYNNNTKELVTNFLNEKKFELSGMNA
jgi:tetratricopeptide (TPR) repeat protein